MRVRTIIHNRAKALRKVMTAPETMLWSRLRGRSDERPHWGR